VTERSRKSNAAVEFDCAMMVMIHLGSIVTVRTTLNSGMGRRFWFWARNGMGYRLAGHILDEIHTGVHTLSIGFDLEDRFELAGLFHEVYRAPVRAG
jgi:hypothetical protein